MTLSRGALLLVALLAGAAPALAQELEPRAYSISPVGVNIVVAGYTYNSGDVTFAPALPVEDASAHINTGVLAYVRTLGLLGRSSSIAVSIPYIKGDLQGKYIGEFARVDRSGLADPRLRFVINLYGAPRMDLREFAAYRQRTNIGFSLNVVAPLGQYDPTKLVNLGSNRWSFKPEIAISQRWNRWILEIYAGVWMFTDNDDFYGGRLRQQQAIGSTQFHLVYTLSPRAWVAVNANFYTGGETIVDGNKNFDLQKNSRVGATFAVPLDARQALKFNYSRGAFTTIGADFHSFSVGYQFLWGAGL
ncbi:MAG: transporter [Acidobacteriota bacterium]